MSLNTEPPRFDFGQEPDSLEQAVHIVVGYASVCWDNLKGAGVFQSENALAASTALVEWVNAHFIPKSALSLGDQIIAQELPKGMDVPLDESFFTGYKTVDWANVIRPEDDPQQLALFEHQIENSD